MSESAPAAAPAAAPAQSQAAPDASQQQAAAPTQQQAAPASPAQQQGFFAQKPAEGSQQPTGGADHFFNDSVQEGGQFKEGWTQKLQEMGLERLATKASMVKDEATLFKTLDSALGLIGKKQEGFNYPREDSTPDQITAFRKEAGVPESLDGYELKPADLPAELSWNDEQAGKLAEIMHKHHIPKAAAQELTQIQGQLLMEQYASTTAEQSAKSMEAIQNAEATFKQEWGADYDSRYAANVDFVTSRFSDADLQNPAIQQAMSHPEVVRMVDEARRALRASAPPAQGMEVGSNTLSPRQQGQQIMKDNPNWRKDPDLVNKVNSFYALESARKNRESGRR